MRKFIIFLVLVNSFVFIGQIGANESDVRTCVIDGDSWVCFTPSDSQYLLDLRIKFPLLQTKIDLLEEKIFVKDSVISKLEENTNLLSDQIGILTDQNVDLQKVIEEADSFWKSPYFWGTLGFITGIVVTVSIVYAVN